jgi:hypothetical protein
MLLFIEREDLRQGLDPYQLAPCCSHDLAWGPTVMPVFAVNAKDHRLLCAKDIDLIFARGMSEDEVIRRRISLSA